jgi:hypothetical protein
LHHFSCFSCLGELVVSILTHTAHNDLLSLSYILNTHIYLQYIIRLSIPNIREIQ